MHSSLWGLGVTLQTIVTQNNFGFLFGNKSLISLVTW